MTRSTLSIDFQGTAVEVVVDDYGALLSQPFLLLHGGGGPDTVLRFGEHFSETKDVRVIAPTHPGFAGTDLSSDVRDIKNLAELYVRLIEQLDLEAVTVIGNSIGGWIAAEMALLGSSRVRGIVLIDAVGIDVAEHPVADFFTMTYDEFVERAFHEPDRFRVDLSKLPAAAQEIAGKNRVSLASYVGGATSDPTLSQRLASLELPTLVIWGESDHVADTEYGRAYGRAVPMARFALITAAGHTPQMEQPDEVIRAIWDSNEPQPISGP